MQPEYLGRGGRLAGGPAPDLVRAAYAVEASHGPRLARGLSIADLAHAVELVESGSLDPARGGRLCAGLLALLEIEPDDFPWRPEIGDAFNSREAALEERIGRDAAGWLSAGRPRREAFRVGLRQVARHETLELIEAVASVIAVLAELAGRHADDLAADYTYLQPAQPSTVGHVLLAWAEPHRRDLRRLAAIEEELSRSVAGAGGSAGSRWPIDRARLASSLGADGIVDHTRDAAWGADTYAELLAAVALAMGNLSQIAQDLEIYCSQEFRLFELGDRHSRASALMPQKKNPYALAAIRTQAAVSAGDLTAALVAIHTGSARTDHFHLLNGTVPAAIDRAAAIAFLTAGVLADVTVHVDRFAATARESFIVAADACDVLAMESGIDHRTAHKVIGLAVRRIVDAGLRPDDLDDAAITAAFAEVVGRQLDREVDVARALDPAGCVAARTQAGSCAPGEVRRMAGEARDDAAACSARAARRSEALLVAESALIARARSIAA